jgi:hypothetical protein
MSRYLPHIIPSSQPPAEEAFAAHQTTHEFYQEIRARDEFKRYCEWHRTTARTNCQDLERMRGELNIFAWFRRR